MTEEPEQIIWIGQPSQIENIGIFIICALLSITIVGTVVAIPLATWRYLATRCKRFKLTDQRLVIHSGVLNKKNEQIELFRVRDIDCEQPLSLRLFKLGRLTITSTDRTDPVAVINAIRGGEVIVEQFRRTITKLRQKSRVGVIETM